MHLQSDCYYTHTKIRERERERERETMKKQPAKTHFIHNIEVSLYTVEVECVSES